jgi:histidine triad (HIT) family protein
VSETADCIFCKIVAGEIGAEIVHETEHVVAFRDINPVAPTHVQVIPRRHIGHISDLDTSDGAWLVDLVAAANEVARKEGLELGYRLVVNNGPHAGQSVYHVHLHVVGGRQMGWPPG